MSETERAMENFPLAGRPVHPELVRAYGAVKLACARVNGGPHREAIESACREMAAGALTGEVTVDQLQGGAGTSTNMNVNEVLAARAGVSPADINLHQSTNDTYPTALRIAAIRLLQQLEQRVVELQEAFQKAEQRFAHIVKVGRTEMQDAVLVTLGREMGTYAEALNRDRWRIYKCQERLRVVNLGGTAVGTGLGAPREYIFRVVDELRELTGLPLARAENLIEATQNADVFVEVSGMLKALASSLWKICSDLRLLSSGPEAGIGEIRLPRRQAGSSIMPGKVNPVIPEAVTQVAMLVFGYDAALSLACANGSLELNPFLPLVSVCLLESIDLLTRACLILRAHCVEGIEADEARCAAHLSASTATITALLPALGYDEAARLLEEAAGRDVRKVAVESGRLTEEQVKELTSPEAICRLGSRP